MNNEIQLRESLKQMGLTKEDLHESIEFKDESSLDEIIYQNNITNKQIKKSKNQKGIDLNNPATINNIKSLPGLDESN
jgi:hypothetical protein